MSRRLFEQDLLLRPFRHTLCFEVTQQVICLSGSAASAQSSPYKNTAHSGLERQPEPWAVKIQNRLDRPTWKSKKKNFPKPLHELRSTIPLKLCKNHWQNKECQRFINYYTFEGKVLHEFSDFVFVMCKYVEILPLSRISCFGGFKNKWWKMSR